MGTLVSACHSVCYISKNCPLQGLDFTARLWLRSIQRYSILIPKEDSYLQKLNRNMESDIKKPLPLVLWGQVQNVAKQDQYQPSTETQGNPDWELSESRLDPSTTV